MTLSRMSPTASLGGLITKSSTAQMFTDPAIALRGLPGVTVGIKADGSAFLEKLKRLAASIG